MANPTHFYSLPQQFSQQPADTLLRTESELRSRAAQAVDPTLKAHHLNKYTELFNSLPSKNIYNLVTNNQHDYCFWVLALSSLTQEKITSLIHELNTNFLFLFGWTSEERKNRISHYIGHLLNNKGGLFDGLDQHAEFLGRFSSDTVHINDDSFDVAYSLKLLEQHLSRMYSDEMFVAYIKIFQNLDNVTKMTVTTPAISTLINDFLKDHHLSKAFKIEDLITTQHIHSPFAKGLRIVVRALFAYGSTNNLLHGSKAFELLRQLEISGWVNKYLTPEECSNFKLFLAKKSLDSLFLPLDIRHLKA